MVSSDLCCLIHDYIMIHECVLHAEPSTLEPKALIILTITSLFLPLALLHLIMLLLSGNDYCSVYQSVCYS